MTPEGKTHELWHRAAAQSRPFMTFFQLLFDFARRHWRAYAVFAVMLVGISSLQVWLPYQVGRVVDGMVSKTWEMPQVYAALAWMLAAAVGIYLLRAGWRLVLFKAVYQLSVELRTKLFARLAVHAPSFYQNQRTGDLMAAATNDIDAIEMAAGEGALAGFDGALGLVMVTSVMFIGVDWRLALCAMLPFPIMAIAFKQISEKEHGAAKRALDDFGHLNDHVQETLAGVRTVRALGLIQRNSQQFHAHAAQAAGSSFDEQRFEAAYEPAVGMCMAASVSLALGVGSYLVWHNALTIGQLTSFGLYLAQLIWPMFAMGWVLSLIQRGKAAWGRLRPLIDEPVAVQDAGTLAVLPAADLALEGVSFAHPGQARDALHDVSIRVNAGQTLALVGPTGSGKSTVLKLLLRQWTPQSGRVTWGQADTRDYTLQALRAGIAWVPQEPFLFSATVADNIALGASSATREQIENAARLAAVYDDIARLPSGFDTPVGERGVTLSGGQRQRVAIARALLCDAPVLLLDDALSAVDTETETQILTHLRDTLASRTVIVVSHRLSGVVAADEIVVFKQGQVTERGTHAQLEALGGWYARQWRYQQLQASLEAA
jgi:ATP-binding cassette, subfamily B, multidrug efflux pump